MPIRSEAQRRLLHMKADRGEISKATVKHWEQTTKNKNLPERIHPKEKVIKKRATQTKNTSFPYNMGYIISRGK